MDVTNVMLKTLRGREKVMLSYPVSLFSSHIAAECIVLGNLYFFIPI